MMTYDEANLPNLLRCIHAQQGTRLAVPSVDSIAIGGGFSDPMSQLDDSTVVLSSNLAPDIEEGRRPQSWDNLKALEAEMG